MRFLLVLAIALIAISGCDDSGEAAYYPPIPAVDTTNTIDLIDSDTVSTDHDELKINLSQIAGAGRPTFVTVTVEMDEGKIISYSVTTKSKPHSTFSTSSELNYIIKKGDTKTSLSRKFGVPISRIPEPIAGKKLVFKWEN